MQAKQWKSGSATIGVSAVITMGALGVAFRQRQFRRAGTSRKVQTGQQGHRADNYDNDTSDHAGDQLGDPERDRDHAIRVLAGTRSVVAVAQGWALSGHLCDRAPR